MSSLTKEQLLRISEVVEEIKRHLWFESEKAGHDVGFEWAANDWISKYSQAWVDYHIPGKNKQEEPAKKRPSAKPTVTKKRSAKSYVL